MYILVSVNDTADTHQHTMTSVFYVCESLSLLTGLSITAHSTAKQPQNRTAHSSAIDFVDSQSLSLAFDSLSPFIFALPSLARTLGTPKPCPSCFKPQKKLLAGGTNQPSFPPAPSFLPPIPTSMHVLVVPSPRPSPPTRANSPPRIRSLARRFRP